MPFTGLRFYGCSCPVPVVVDYPFDLPPTRLTFQPHLPCLPSVGLPAEPLIYGFCGWLPAFYLVYIPVPVVAEHYPRTQFVAVPYPYTVWTFTTVIAHIGLTFDNSHLHTYGCLVANVILLHIRHSPHTTAVGPTDLTHC